MFARGGWSGLGKGHNACAFVKAIGGDVRRAQRLEEDARPQDDFKSRRLPDFIADMKQAIAQLDVRLLLNEKHSVQITQGHTPSAVSSAERGDCSIAKVNGSLRAMVLAQVKAFAGKRPAEQYAYGDVPRIPLEISAGNSLGGRAKQPPADQRFARHSHHDAARNT